MVPFDNLRLVEQILNSQVITASISIFDRSLFFISDPRGLKTENNKQLKLIKNLELLKLFHVIHYQLKIKHYILAACKISSRSLPLA